MTKCYFYFFYLIYLAFKKQTTGGLNLNNHENLIEKFNEAIYFDRSNNVHTCSF